VFERFSHEARRVVVLAQAEARSLDHDYIGTEHLLLGLLAEREGLGASVLAAFGISREGIRTAVREIVGSGELTEPDPEALEAIGIDLDAVRATVEQAFGPGALEGTRAARRRRTRCRRGRAHRPFTPRAKRVCELSLREAVHLRHRHIGSEHLLLGIIREGEGVAAQLLARSGVDLVAARRRVLEEMARRADKDQ
jgi:ATP-dependent Clp protease ATP-binding subunit ClpA